MGGVGDDVGFGNRALGGDGDGLVLSSFGRKFQDFLDNLQLILRLRDLTFIF